MSFGQILRDTLGLDIREINYMWGLKADAFKRIYHKNGILKEFGKYLYRLARAIREAMSAKPRSPLPERAILFYADSINQFRAMEPIKARVPEGIFWVERGLPGDLPFPGWFARSAALLFLPALVIRALMHSSVRQTLSYSLADYLECYGYYLTGLLWLRRLAPRALVLSNDHCAQPRALMYAARHLSIPTVYIQHSSVTENFPPLEFDYAFLDGMDALRKYRMGSRCRAYLVGNSRRVPCSRSADSSAGDIAIGLAFNDMDSKESVEHVVADVRQEMKGARISIRPHPGDLQRLDWFKILAQRTGAEFSDPRAQTVWEFLRGIDVLVAGNSNIFLDAAMASVVPCQHETLGRGYDHYGFARAGIVRIIRSAAEVQSLLADLPRFREELRRKLWDYDATIGTELDGRAAELAASIVRERILGVRGIFEEVPLAAARCFTMKPAV